MGFNKKAASAKISKANAKISKTTTKFSKVVKSKLKKKGNKEAERSKEGTDDRKKSSNVLIKLFPMLLANINSNFSLDD